MLLDIRGPGPGPSHHETLPALFTCPASINNLKICKALPVWETGDGSMQSSPEKSPPG